MADWNEPTVTDQWEDLLNKLKDRQIDAAIMFKNPALNIPVSTIRLERTTMILQEWDGTNWVTIILSLSGGGTGASDAARARANLGIGSLGAQDANDVDITGGTITGMTDLELASDLTLAADQAYDLGSSDKQFRNGYFKSGIVIPVGTDKWVTI